LAPPLFSPPFPYPYIYTPLPWPPNVCVHGNVSCFAPKGANRATQASSDLDPVREVYRAQVPAFSVYFIAEQAEVKAEAEAINVR